MNRGSLPHTLLKDQKALRLLLSVMTMGSYTSICIPTIAFAQSATIEEVQVTARRRVEKDIDVPISMTVMGEDFLRQQNVGKLTDLGVKVPGLQITSIASPSTPIVSLRGQRPNDLLVSADQAVPIYFNDIVMTPAEGANLAMYDLANVQVLKGPQGTLFGRNSTGGALFLTPVRPGTQPGGYLEIKAGNYELISVEGAIDLPVNDVLQFRLSGRILNRDGYQKNVADNELNGKRLWDEDSSGVRLSMNLEPSDTIRNLLVLAYDQNDSIAPQGRLEAFNGSAFVARRMYNAFFNQNGDVDRTVERISSRDNKHLVETDVLSVDEVETKFASNTTEIDLSDSLTLKAILGYRGVTYSTSTDNDGSAYPWINAVVSDTESVTRNPPKITTETDQYSFEVQFLGDALDGDLEWIAGLYWFDMKGTVGGSLVQVMGPVPGDVTYDPFWRDPDELPVAQAWTYSGVLVNMPDYGVYQSGNNGDLHNQALGAFTEATLVFNPQWSTTLGLRYSYDEREVTVRPFSGIGRYIGQFPAPGVGLGCSLRYLDSMGATQIVPNDQCERVENDTFESPSGRLSVNYTPTDGSLIFASVSTGYRTGGFNMRGNASESLAPFDPETVTSYEIGNKTDWSDIYDIPLRTDIAIYYQDYKDIQQTQTFVQATSTSGSFDTRIVNAGEATIYGLEFDITYAATENLSLTLSYSYTKPEFKEFNTQIIQSTLPSEAIGRDVDASDADFPFIPEHSLRASMTYYLPLDAELGNISIMANVYWQDEVATALDGTLNEDIAAIQKWTAEDLQIAEDNRYVDGYTLVNLRLDWASVLQSNFDVALYVDNATNEDYVTGGLNVMTSLGVNVNSYGAPRTFGASVRYNF